MNTSVLSTPRNQARRALLVDDDKFMLEVLGDMLLERGVGSVITALNGVAGFEAYERMNPSPDLVVCDLNMPENDGFQFMEKLGACGFAGGVLLVSGMDDRVRKSAALMGKFYRLKLLGTLSKPVDEAALSAALAKLA